MGGDRDVFQRGLHDYLKAHRFGSATADDFLAAESGRRRQGRQDAVPHVPRSPGVPFVEAEVKCDGAPARPPEQSRYLRSGSTGDANKTWQIPVCARFQSARRTKEACTLLTDREGNLPLGATCPDWVFPNSDSTGNFRFVAPAHLLNLRKKGFSAYYHADA